MKQAGLLAGLLALVLAVGGWAGVAHAGLEICNKTNEVQSIAIGYKGDTDWTSEGWWNIKPDDCATLVGGDLTKRYYYYHADSKGDRFRGQDFIFCTRQDEFTIVGDTDCDNRGYLRAEFREIDTGETATSFTLTLVAQPGSDDGGSDAGANPESEGVAVEDGDVGTQNVSETLVEPSVEIDETALLTGLPPGRSGEPFEQRALFQGCEIEDGRAYCGFHASGLKLRAYYKGPTPKELMYALEEMPMNTPVMVEGDRVDKNRLHAAVVLRAVKPRAGDDKLAKLRSTLQGDWAVASDRKSVISIHGSEIYVRYNGDFRQTRFLQLSEDCEGLRGAGPVLVQTSLRDLKPKCYKVGRADARGLELAPVLGGDTLRFERVR